MASDNRARWRVAPGVTAHFPLEGALLFSFNDAPGDGLLTRAW